MIAKTAIQGKFGPHNHVRYVQRKKGCNGLLIDRGSPSLHGGRGALPSEGGSPSDLLFLAGGGSF